MKTILQFLILALIISSQGMAQQKQPTANRQSGTGSSSVSGSPSISGTGFRLVEGNLEGDLGSLYIGDDWPEGVVVLKGGKMIENYRYRYDIYSDQMQFIAGLDTLAFASPGEIYTVAFNGRTFVYEPYECNGMLMKGYFEMVVPGKKQLLLKRSVTFHMPDEAQEYAIEKDTYLVSECYFLKNANQPAFKVMCNRKSALIAMGDRKYELEAYLKQTGNKVKNLEDLKKMVEYYNSLE